MPLGQISIHKHTRFHFSKVPRAKVLETESRMVGARAWGGGDGKLVFNGDTVSAGKDEHILEVMAARWNEARSCARPGGGVTPFAWGPEARRELRKGGLRG